MKKLPLILTLCLLSSAPTFAQFGGKTWKTFFPAQEKLVGKTCAGPIPAPICTGEPAAGADLQTSKSIASLDQTQKRALRIKYADLFGFKQNYVGNIVATGIKLDYVSTPYLDKTPRGVRFIYGGLRADGVQITVKKDQETKTNPQAVVDRLIKALGAAYPHLPLEKIKELLPDEISQEGSNSYTIRISEPSVYFMVQYAELTIRDPQSFFGNENVLVFSPQNQGACDYISSEFVLANAEPQSCAIVVPVPNRSSKIRMILKYHDGKLFLVHNSANRNDVVEVEIKESSSDRWQNNIGQLIYRYPVETSGDNTRWKEVYLFINATRVEDGIRVIKKAGEKNFPTRISYPTLELKVID